MIGDEISKYTALRRAVHQHQLHKYVRFLGSIAAAVDLSQMQLYLRRLVDMGGRMRFGPDVEWLATSNLAEVDSRGVALAYDHTPEAFRPHLVTTIMAGHWPWRTSQDVFLLSGG